MTPERRRPRQPGAVAVDTVFVRVTARGLPPDPDPYEGQRIGRPERSPSLPPPDDEGGPKPQAEAGS